MADDDRQVQNLGGGPTYVSTTEATQDIFEFTGQTSHAFNPGDASSYDVLLHASRLVDGLVFKTDSDDRTETYRYPIGGTVPLRVSKAVSLIADALPEDGAPVVDAPARNPDRIRAGEVEVEYPNANERVGAEKSDDQILADRLGIPSLQAFRLLRPFLLLPDSLEQGSGARGISSGGFVVFTNAPPATTAQTLEG